MAGRLEGLIVLHYYLDLPLPDVAGALGIPLGRRNRVSIGLSGMRAALDADTRSNRSCEGASHERPRFDGFLSDG